MSIQPAAGQPVYDTRNNRQGVILEIPSPYSPYIRVQWGTEASTVSLENLAYGRPECTCTWGVHTSTTYPVGVNAYGITANDPDCPQHG